MPIESGCKGSLPDGSSSRFRIGGGNNSSRGVELVMPHFIAYGHLDCNSDGHSEERPFALATAGNRTGDWNCPATIELSVAR